MKKIVVLTLVVAGGLAAKTLPGPIDIFQQPAFYGNAPRLICGSPGDSVFAFVWNKAGYPNGDIWLADIPSGKLRQLTHFNDNPTADRIEELQWFPDRQRLLFLWKGDIYSISPATRENPIAMTITPSCEMLPRISPNSRYVSFIRDNTLRLMDLRENREIELSETMAADWKVIGQYCTENQYTPYYWTPDETALVIPAYNGNFAGELMYFDLINQETRIITLSDNDDLLFRDIIWIQSKNRLVVDCLSGNLRQRSILWIDVESFKIDTVYNQTSELWCSNFGGKLYWLESGGKLLFGDIQNGYQHIFTIGPGQKSPISITRGKWNVFDYIVSNENDQIYFSANKDNHYEKHIYTIDRKTDKVLNLSYLRGSHDFVLSATGQYIVDIFSTPDIPQQLYLTRTFPVSKARLFLKPDVRIPNADNLKNALDKKTINPISGEDIYYKLWYPAGELSADKFPLIVFLNNSCGPVDGLHQWRKNNLISQWLSSKGYVVAEIDFPGLGWVPNASAPMDSLQPWKFQIQTIGYVLDELSNQEFIDMTRVGITGFGYNGYLSISALLERAGNFSVCVSIIPDNQWGATNGLYERIIYREMAERGLNFDFKSPDIAGRLRGKLLLIYGKNCALAPLLDSESFIRRMVNSRKRIDFIHYPWENTVIRSDQTYIDLLYKLLEYFDRFL